MNLEECGALIKLMVHCFLQGSLPNASTTLARLCGNPANWEEISAAILPLFVEKDGRLIHPDIEKQLAKKEQWRRKSSIGGQRGAAARKRIKNQNNGGSKGGSSIVGKVKKPETPIIIYNNKNEHQKELLKDKSNRITDDQFEELWKDYPGDSEQKGSKLKAKKKILARGFKYSFVQTKSAFINYGRNSKKVADGYVKQMTTFLNGDFIGQWLNSEQTNVKNTNVNESRIQNLRRVAL